MCMSITCVATS